MTDKKKVAEIEILQIAATVGVIERWKILNQNCLQVWPLIANHLQFNMIRVCVYCYKILHPLVCIDP